MRDMMITPELLDRWDACAEGKEWGLSVIGAGMKLSELLPKFERADWMVWTLGKAQALDKIQYFRIAVICAESVLHIYEEKYPNDPRPREAIKSAKEYYKNPTKKNRNAAASAADNAARAVSYAAASAAGNAARAVSYAAGVARAADDAIAYSTTNAAIFAARAVSDATTHTVPHAIAYSTTNAALAASGSAAHHKKLCASILAEIEKFDKGE